MGIQRYKRISITIERSLLEKFRKYCKDEGMNVSSRISILIKKDLEKGDKNGKQSTLRT